MRHAVALLAAVACACAQAEETTEQPSQKDSLLPYWAHELLDQSNEATSFTHAFIASFAVIIVSELGDKTFFIAAIMAMKHPRSTVFLGAISALIMMTVLSTYVGYAVTIIPRVYTQYISTALFAIFGCKMLHDGWKMSPDEGQEEYEEVSLELKKRDEQLQKTDLEAGPLKAKKFMNTIFAQACVMTAVAEWGDRSQIATIVLGARENPIGVMLGGVIGHAMCTALAVVGGRLVAQRISVRTVTLIGGLVFLLFAIAGLFIED
eukprot:m.71280 g.71280  ORF g.71280 m.71280 type:complete len:264 (+) comp50173_c0_seq1:199-990(+)